MAHKFTWANGFEKNHAFIAEPNRDGGLAWGNGEVSVSAAQARNGSYSLLLSSMNSSSHSAFYIRRFLNTAAKWGTGGGPFWLMFDLYFTSYASTRSKWFFTGDTFSLEVNSTDHKIRMYQSTTVRATSTNTVTTGQWYTVSIGHNGSTGRRVIFRNADTLEVVWDSGLVTTFPSESSSILYLGSVSDCRIACHYDNIVVEADASWSNIDDPFELLSNNFGITTMLAGSDGYYAEWSGGRNYLDVDEMPHDGLSTVDYNQAHISLDKLNSYGIQAFVDAAVSEGPMGRIHLVMPFAACRTDNVANNFIGGIRGVRIGGADYGNLNPDGSWFEVPHRYTMYAYDLNPADSEEWTLADLEAMEVIIIQTAMFTARYYEVTQVGITVLHDFDYGGNQIISVPPV